MVGTATLASRIKNGSFLSLQTKTIKALPTAPSFLPESPPPNSICPARLPEPKKILAHSPSITNSPPTNQSPSRVSPPTFSNTIQFLKKTARTSSKTWVNPGSSFTTPISSASRMAILSISPPTPTNGLGRNLSAQLKRLSIPFLSTQSDPLYSHPHRHHNRLPFCHYPRPKARQKNQV